MVLKCLGTKLLNFQIIWKILSFILLAIMIAIGFDSLLKSVNYETRVAIVVTTMIYLIFSFVNYSIAAILAILYFIGKKSYVVKHYFYD
jgi:uncharacterized Tic20 family protein